MSALKASCYGCGDDFDYDDSVDRIYCRRCRCRYCERSAARGRLCSECWKDGDADAYVDRRKEGEL